MQHNMHCKEGNSPFKGHILCTIYHICKPWRTFVGVVLSWFVSLLYMIFYPLNMHTISYNFNKYFEQEI